jgi:hypothetical protein
MFVRWIVVVVALVGLVGCGGKGSSTPSARPFFSITWPERTKTATATTSALSAVVTCTSLVNNQTSTAEADRPTGTTSTSPQYTCNKALPLGQLNFAITFYDEAKGAGDIVGQATTAAVMTSTTGELLNASNQILSVSLVNTVSTVNITVSNAVATTATVVAGSTLQLGFQALNSSGTALANVSDGSQDFTSENPAFATVTPTGLVTGVAAGTATIQCSVDGVSTTLTLTVTAK